MKLCFSIFHEQVWSKYELAWPVVPEQNGRLLQNFWQGRVGKYCASLMNLLILIKSFFLINILKSRDGSININEFTTLCTALFRNEAGKPYKLDQGENNSELILIVLSYKFDNWETNLCDFELDLSLLCSFGHGHVYDLQHLRGWKHEQVLYFVNHEI